MPGSGRAVDCEMPLILIRTRQIQNMLGVVQKQCITVKFQRDRKHVLMNVSGIKNSAVFKEYGAVCASAIALECDSCHNVFNRKKFEEVAGNRLAAGLE